MNAIIKLISVHPELREELLKTSETCYLDIVSIGEELSICQIPEGDPLHASPSRVPHADIRLSCFKCQHSRQKEVASPLCLLLVYLWLTYLITCLFMHTNYQYLLLLSSGDFLCLVSRYLLIVKRNTRCKCPEWTPNQSVGLLYFVVTT